MGTRTVVRTRHAVGFTILKGRRAQQFMSDESIYFVTSAPGIKDGVLLC